MQHCWKKLFLTTSSLVLLLFLNAEASAKEPFAKIIVKKSFFQHSLVYQENGQTCAEVKKRRGSLTGVSSRWDILETSSELSTKIEVAHKNNHWAAIEHQKKMSDRGRFPKPPTAVKIHHDLKGKWGYVLPPQRPRLELRPLNKKQSLVFEENLGVPSFWIHKNFVTFDKNKVLQIDIGILGRPKPLVVIRYNPLEYSENVWQLISGNSPWHIYGKHQAVPKELLIAIAIQEILVK